MGSANIIAARVTGADPKVLAAVIRGAVAPTLPIDALNKINVPVLILNGKADVANQIQAARSAQVGVVPSSESRLPVCG